LLALLHTSNVWRNPPDNEAITERKVLQRVERPEQRECEREGFGFLISCLDFGFGVWGLGFGVWGLRFGVWGFGFGV
jgi:hypothetical protein